MNVSDIQIENVYRTMAILPSETGLQEDDVVNTFHWRNLSANPLLKPLLRTKTYRTSEDKPRTPWENESARPATQRSPLPEEVAICLSYYSGKNTPRTRGRIYIGPCGQQVLAANEGRTHVATASRNTLRNAAIALRDNSIAQRGLEWGFLSTGGDPAAHARGNAPAATGPAFHAIDAGWVDDAFDTMRKRGPKAAVRTMFEPAL
jgi:hypothetical protein